VSYIDGLASGLDTTSIINSLMQVESIPKILLENKATSIKAGLDSYASIRTKITAVRTAAEALSSATGWSPLTASSSNSDTVAASAGTGSPGGSVTFSVVSLASAMQRSSADTFAALDADLAGRTLSLTSGAHTFDSTATTLSGLVDEINADTELGVRATTLQVSPGSYRLVLSAKETGLENAFTAASSGWSNGFTVTAAATDATLDVGGIVVTRPSNTISDLVAGATFTLKAVSATPVTVSVERDTKAISAKVEKLVAALNGAMDEIKLRTGYDSETRTRSSLTGDPAARSVSQRLTQAVIAEVAGATLGSVGLSGVELGRDGKFKFDSAKFEAAYLADPAAVQAVFAEGGSATGGVTFERASWRAQAGTYAVEVTESAGVYTAKIDGQDATVTVNDDGSLKIAMDTLHARLGGLTVQVAAGSLPVGATSEVGQVTYAPGAAKRLVSMTNGTLDPIDGTLTSAEDSRKARIADIERQVSAWELRLEKRETAIRRQYTALETMMGQLANQSTWLTGQLSGLAANNVR
jgi:flagellar hook-associated protein 2